MEALVFSSEEALQVAMRSGLVPQKTQRKRATVVVSESGEWEILPASKLSSLELGPLLAIGVKQRALSAVFPRVEVSCWAEALPLCRAEEKGLPPKVLFVVHSSAQLLEIAAELLRLGCDRQHLAVARTGDYRGLILVQEPPWLVLLRAAERDGIRALIPASPNTNGWWVEWGWRHPLQTQLAPMEEGFTLLLQGERWLFVESCEWVEVRSQLIPAGISPAAVMSAADQVPKLTVPLFLRRSALPQTATLFVIAQGAPAVEALVRSTPEVELRHMDFAVCGELVLLRARPGRGASVVEWPGEAFATVDDIPHLYAPVGMALEPPMSREHVRTWLGAHPNDVTWLCATAHGIQPYSLPESSFRPLQEWVDYRIDGATQTLLAWTKSATFDFAPYEVAEDVAVAVPVPGPIAVPPPPVSAPRMPRQRTKKNSGELPLLSSSVVAPSPPRATQTSLVGSAHVAVAEAERAWTESDASPLTPERQARWVQLAQAYAGVGRLRDAGIAWAHVLWNVEDSEALALWSDRWAKTVRSIDIASPPEKSLDEVHSVVACLLLASFRQDSSLKERATEWNRWLERYADELDVRTYWLARCALARVSGGDELGLARARDRLLMRLQNGLSLDRDVPRFLRALGRGTELSAMQRTQHVATQLDSLLHAFSNTTRKRYTIEAPFSLTKAYLCLQFAWGFARLGHGERADALLEESSELIQSPDAVHSYLLRAYGARVMQAREALPPTTPLPPDINAQLVALEHLARYKVDRLRQFSQILEPQERLEAISALFWKSGAEARGEELAALRALRDPSELLKGIRARMGVAVDMQLSLDERVRLMDGLLDFLPSLPETHAVPLLHEFLTLSEDLSGAHRAVILEDALKVAGHFGRASLVKQLVSQLGASIREVGAAGVEPLGRLLVSGVRTLRRVGLKAEAGELLSRAASLVQGDDLPTLHARLGLAGGFMYLGANEQAQPIVDQAMARLGRESGLIIAERLKLTRATASALALGASETALPGLTRLAQQLPWITDSFNTNTHYCLSLLCFADALVLGYVGDDLTLTDVARRFLEEDEYLVRRKLHADVGEPS